MQPGRVRYAVEGWGVGELWLEDERLLGHELPRPDVPLTDPVAAGRPNAPWGAARAPAVSVAGDPSRIRADFVSDLVGRFRRLLAGEAVGLEDLELDLDGETPFGRAATLALRGLPRGEVVTYGELAALAGRPGAGRAAGTFCARNRFALVVPCHRVVAARGIGGYGSLGVAVKRRLLELEGVRL